MKIRNLILLAFGLLPFFAASQTATFDRVRVRQGLNIRAEKADSIIRAVTALSNHTSIPTAKAVWDAIAAIVAASKYQTLRDDGSNMTQQPAANFVSTGTVAFTLTNDAGNTETEVSASVPAGGITSTELAASSVNSSKIRDTTIVAGDIKNATITSAKLANSGVTAGTYPSTNALVAQFAVNAQGQITAVTQISAADVSATNEGILGVSANGSNDAGLISNTSTANTVVIAGGTAIAVSETTNTNGGTVTITNTGDTDGTNDLTVSDTVRTVTAASTHSKYPTALAVYNAIIAGGTARPDSTFAKAPGGGYAGKRITDNVYRTGKTSFGRPDTTATVTISEGGVVTSNPALLIRGRTQGADSANIFIRLRSSAVDSTEDFVIGAINSGEISGAGDNTSWYFGHNVFPGGARINTGKSACFTFWEDNFINSLPVIGSVPSYEFHHAFVPSNAVGGAQIRYLSTSMDHLGRTSDMSLVADKFTIRRFGHVGGFRPSKPEEWMVMDFYNKSMTLNDSCQLVFGENGLGAGGVYQSNAAGSSLLNLMSADASDRIVNGGTGVTGVLMPSGKLDILGSGEVFNTTGNLLTIGTSGAPTTLRVNANGNEALTLKSTTGGSNAWTTYINASSRVETLPSGAAYMETYSNAPYLLLANNKLGIGTNLDSRLSITQIGNGAQGGIGLVNLSGIASYLQTNAGGNFSYIDNAGASKFEVGTDGGGFGGAPISGWRLYSNGAFRADGAITARGTGTSPSLLLNNTTASTGKEWYINSVNAGSLVIGNPTSADAITINGTTGATTIANTLTVSTATGTATTVTGRTSAGVITDVTVGSGLSLSGGTLSATGGGGSPGGSTTQAQYNNSGSFDGATGLTFDGSENPDFTQAVSFSGDITPSNISGTNNDYAPTSFSTASTIRQTNSAGAILTGIAGGADGRTIIWHNIGSENLILRNENALSTAANRLTLGGGDLTLRADGTATFRYDATSSRWRLVCLSSFTSGAKVYEFTTGTANFQVNIPAGAKAVDITAVGAGGGGGSGRKGVTSSSRCGGGGGGNGGYYHMAYPLEGSDAATFYVNVGTGGTGGASQTTNSTNGSAGTAGGETDVRVDGTATTNRIFRAGGGNAGNGGTTSGGTGGSAINVTQLSCNNGAAANGSGGNGGNGGTTNNGVAGSAAAGGGVTAANSASTGGTGGDGAQGLQAGGAANGGNATAISKNRDSGGGGGGGNGSTSGNATAGGNGVRGGGGGGGGAATDSVGNSGAGGAGGDGYVKIVFFF